MKSLLIYVVSVVIISLSTTSCDDYKRHVRSLREDHHSHVNHHSGHRNVSGYGRRSDPFDHRNHRENANLHQNTSHHANMRLTDSRQSNHRDGHDHHNRQASDYSNWYYEDRQPHSHGHHQNVNNHDRSHRNVTHGRHNQGHHQFNNTTITDSRRHLTSSSNHHHNNTAQRHSQGHGRSSSDHHQGNSHWNPRNTTNTRYGQDHLTNGNRSQQGNQSRGTNHSDSQNNRNYEMPLTEYNSHIKSMNRTANLTKEARDAARIEFPEFRFPLITAPLRNCPEGQKRDRLNNCRPIF